MEERNREILIQGVLELGVRLELSQVEQLERYLFLLDKWSQRMNLTGIRGERERVILLLLDSLAVVPVLDEIFGKRKNRNSSGNGLRQTEIRLMDLGSGAGAPGIPVKVARPGWEMTLSESREKRVSFLREVVRELGLRGVEVYHGRVGRGDLRGKNFGQVHDEGDKFHGVMSRAVGEIGALARTCSGLVLPLGFVIAMKGPSPEAELEKALVLIEKVGFEVYFIRKYLLPYLNRERSLVVLRKRDNVSRETFL